MFLFLKKKTIKKHTVYFRGISGTTRCSRKQNNFLIYAGKYISTRLLLHTKYKHLWIESKTPLCNTITRFNFNITNISKSEQTSIFNLFIPSNINMSTKIQFILHSKPTNIFYYVFDFRNFKQIYTASYGNYILLNEISWLKKKITFTFPSKKKLITSIWVLGNLGRNILYGRKKYTSLNMRESWRPSNFSVRGVAKNPVDHHNGGRSKKKPLFLNKYNNIAKCNK